ncbi:MAG: hypothetical protein SFW67_28585 [Myxococcaceae bacterium]|nr:hypothetical protein [Myxococcaceae bacterium]
MKTHPMACRADGCKENVGKFGDLVCPACWKLVPRKLRQLFIEELNKRDAKDKPVKVMAIAGAVLATIDIAKKKIEAERLVKPATVEEMNQLTKEQTDGR